MRIAIVHGRKYYLRNITTTLEALAERDHELVFSMSERKAFTRRVPRTLRDHPRISMAIYPAHRDDVQRNPCRIVTSEIGLSN